MEIITEECIRGDLNCEAGVRFQNSCGIKGDLRVKGPVEGKTLRVEGKIIAEGDVLLDGDLNAYEVSVNEHIEIETWDEDKILVKKESSLRAKTISTWGSVCVSGDLISDDFIFSGVRCGKMGYGGSYRGISHINAIRIIAGGDVISIGEIYTTKGIESGKDIISVLEGISAIKGNIVAKGHIRSGEIIIARGINAEKFIVSGWKIICKHELRCGKGYKIFAGISYPDVPRVFLEDPSIVSGKIVGEIGYGRYRKPKRADFSYFR